MVTTDSIACDRNYFSRTSSAAQGDADDAEERAHILIDALLLKKRKLADTCVLFKGISILLRQHIATIYYRVRYELFL